MAAAVGLLGALASPAGASAATVGDPGGDVVVSTDGVSWGPTNRSARFYTTPPTQASAVPG
jgi:hypothetical protein